MVLSNYKFLWGDYAEAWSIQTNIERFSKFRSETLWNQVDNIIQVLGDNNCRTFHSKKDLNNDIARGKNFLDNGFSQEFIKNLEKRYKETWELFNELKGIDPKELSNQKLFSFFKRASDRWAIIIGYFSATQAEGTHYLVEKLKKHFSEKETNLLMLPTELDIANKELLDWQELVKKPYSKENLLNHTSKYPWIVLKHFSLKEMLETLTQRYNFDKKQGIFQDIIKEKEELKKKQVALLSKYPQIKETVSLLQRLSLSRMEVKSCWAGIDFYIIGILEEISKRYKEKTENLIKHYRIEEIESLTLNRIKIPAKDLEKRKKCTVVLWKDNKVQFIYGDEAEKIAKSELKELYEVEIKKEIKGIPANHGIAKGIARILEANNFEQTRELRKTFKKGEILITQMTQPTVIDIAAKAAALVTDEGGMLSHAAIISRELKIPCVVGTHTATSNFKDGDLIEVDANKGIVKLLK